MSFTHTSWQKLLSDLSQLFSLSPPPHPALSKEVSSKCLFCSQFSICFSIPSRECCDMTNQKHYTQDERRFVKEGAAFGTAAREGPGDVALGWEVPFLRASTEISEGLPVSLGQLGSGPRCTSGCSLFKCACTIPPFIWYHFLKGLRKASALHLTLHCFMILFQ